MKTAKAEFWLLHLSDFHFGSGDARHAWDIKTVCANIPQALADAGVPAPNYVVLTGDISQAGKDDDFNQAEACLRALGSALGVDLERFLFVPGNHDCDESLLNEKRRKLTSVEASDIPSVVDQYWTSNRACLEAPFQAFSAFVNRLTGCARPVSEPWAVDVPFSDLSLQLVGINTALVTAAGKASDLGRLTLGGHVQNWLGRPVGDRTLRVLLAHHPVEWLHERDAISLNAQLARGSVAAFLSGHIHLAEGAVDHGNRSVRLQAGAAFSADMTSGYSIGAYKLVREGHNNHVQVERYVMTWRQAINKFELDGRSLIGPAAQTYLIVRTVANPVFEIDARFEQPPFEPTKSKRRLAGILSGACALRMLTPSQARHIQSAVQWCKSRAISHKQSGQMAIELGLLTETQRQILIKEQGNSWEPLANVNRRTALDKLYVPWWQRTLPRRFWVVAGIIVAIGGLAAYFLLGAAWWSYAWAVVSALMIIVALCGVEAPAAATSTVKPLLLLLWSALVVATLACDSQFMRLVATCTMALVGAAAFLGAFWRQYRIVRSQKQRQHTQTFLTKLGSRQVDDGAVAESLSALAQAVDQNPWPRFVNRIRRLLGNRSRFLRAVSVIYLVPETVDGRVVRLRPEYWRCLHGVGDIDIRLKKLTDRLRKCLFDREWFAEHVEKPRLSASECRKLPDVDERISLVGAAYTFRRMFLMSDQRDCYAYSNRFLSILAGSGDDDGSMSASLDFQSGVVVPVPPNRDRCLDQHGVLAVYRNIKNGLSRDDVDCVLSAARALGAALDQDRNRARPAG
jgi:hypothetical protein